MASVKSVKTKFPYLVYYSVDQTDMSYFTSLYGKIIVWIQSYFTDDTRFDLCSGVKYKDLYVGEVTGEFGESCMCIQFRNFDDAVVCGLKFGLPVVEVDF